MAQTNSPDVGKKQPRRKKAEKPYVEQIDELLLVHNKSDPQRKLGVISEVDRNGNYKTVDPQEKKEHEFLKFDRNSSILENFIKNFWRQLKNPTHFRLIRLTLDDYRRNKQVLKDLAEGKETDAVKEFLKNYEIVPKTNNQKEEEKTTMAKKQEQTPQVNPEQVSQVEAAATGQEQQVSQPQQQKPSYRYDENMINWEELNRFGISKEMLEQSGVLDGMLKGYKTNRTMPLTLNIPGVLTAKLDARLSLMPQDGQVLLGIHGIRKEPELDRPYFGHIFTEEDKKNLRESGNMGRVVELSLKGKNEPCLISIDKNTNELVAVRQEQVYIPEEIKGVKLTQDEIQKLKNGEKIFVDGMTSANGKEFNSHIQYNAERRGIEFIFNKEQGFKRNELGGVKLTPMQIQALNEGHTILVEDMKRKDGTQFSSFVTMDKVTNDLRYTRHNPETGEIYIPKEISSVQLAPEDKEALRKGQPVFLENMINKKGEEFSSFVRLDMASGRPQYSRTLNGFEERTVPSIPAELYGHLLTAKEKATLQDGKALLLSDLKGPNGQAFSAYAKLNPNSGQVQYFQENPDIRRDTSRRASQTENNSRQQEQKQGSKQAV